MTTSTEQMRAWTGPAILTYGFRPFFFGGWGLSRLGNGALGADAVGRSDLARRL